MNILFWIEPLIMHNRPFHYWAWLDFASRMERAFRESGRGDAAFRFAMNEALPLRATAPYERTPRSRPRRGQGIEPGSIVAFAQEEIRGIFDGPSRGILEALHRGACPGATLDRYADLVRRKLDGFEPDVVIAWTPVSFLRRAFPNALVFGIECGPFSRPPYPSTLFFDPLGIWEDSIPSVLAGALRERRPEPAEADLLERMRAHYRPWFRDASPFHGLEERMRKLNRALLLLPLQFAGESGFDLNAPFGNQGEYLFHVLERLPEGVGLIVVEHPTAIWVGDAIDEESREYVEDRYPQVCFVDHRATESSGQVLLHHVDGVISVSSSIGLQAIFWQKPLIALGRSQLRPYTAFDSIEMIDPEGLKRPVTELDGAMAWLLTRYYTDVRYAIEDAEWIVNFIRACRERRGGLDMLPVVAPIDELARNYCPPLPDVPARRASIAGLLHNADFSLWSEGPGPFRIRCTTADAWELVPGEGGGAQVRRVGETNGIQIERRKATPTPILLLQRIPDVHALSGAFVNVRFRARSATSEPVQVYLYQQFDTNRIEPSGTPARVFHPSAAWRTFTYESVVPVVPGAPAPGPGNHTELVFGLLPGDAPASVEIRDVEVY